ncbi:hypothetical protein ACIBKX_05120 [Streptomyces sp. NPDC050658]|uniref:hypothetical protein n=1 Tax=unclassified Streptomyces TaxID=2593676 RepID=UPI00341BF0BB
MSEKNEQHDDGTHGGGAHGADFSALMLAVTGDAVPAELRDDPEFGAEHAAAVADVALLRDRLGALGDALAERPAPRPAAVPPPPRRTRRPLRLAFGALATAGGLAVAGLVVWAAVQAGGGAADRDAASSGADKAAPDDRQEDSAGSTSPEGFVACSRLIVEGTVTRVEKVPGAARDRITLDAARYLKPESGPRKVTFPMDHDVDPRLKVGDRVLITIPTGESEPDNWAKGKERDSLRTLIVKALPGSREVRCD